MARQGAGRVINIASELAYLGRENCSVYCASKGGVLSMTRSWAREFAPRHPGQRHRARARPTRRCSAPAPPRPRRWPRKRRTRSGRIARPEEIAAAAVFLAGPGRHLHDRPMHQPERRGGDVLAGCAGMTGDGGKRVHGRADLAGVRAEGEGRASPCSCRSARPSSTGRTWRCRSTSSCRPPSASAWRARSAGSSRPTIPYGYKSQPRSGGGEAFPGTTSLDANTFSLVVRDVIRSLGHDGVRRLVVLNGHFENCWPAVEGVDLGLRELRRDGIADMQVMRLEYWDFVQPQHARPAVPGRLPRHRARACEPARDLADAAAPARPRRHGARCPTTARPSSRPTTGIPCPKGFVPASGVLARAERATAEKGQWLMDDHVELITKAVRAEFRL